MPILGWDANVDAIDHYRLDWQRQGSPAISSIGTTNLSANLPLLSFGVWTFKLRAVDAQGRESTPTSLVWTNSPAFDYFLEKSSTLDGPWVTSTNLGSFQMVADGTNGFWRVRIEPQ